MAYYCNKCKEEISDNEAEYSTKNFSQFLCYTCQRTKDTPTHFNPKNKASEPTPEAKRLAKWLRKFGWNAQLEKWDKYKHIDIAITEIKANIEVDGVHHSLNRKQTFADGFRELYSEKKGYKTFRVSNSVLRDEYSTEKYVKEILDKKLKLREKEIEGDDGNGDFDAEDAADD